MFQIGDRRVLTSFCRETHLNGFSTVGAVYDRPYFADSRRNARSQTAPTIPNCRVSRQKLVRSVSALGLLKYAQKALGGPDHVLAGQRPAGVEPVGIFEDHHAVTQDQ